MEKRSTDEYIGQIIRIASITHEPFYIGYDVPKQGVISEEKKWLNEYRKEQYLKELIICKLMCVRFRYNSELIPEQEKEKHTDYKDLIALVERYQYVTDLDVENDIWNSVGSNIENFSAIKDFFKKMIKDEILNIIPDANKYDYKELFFGDNPYRNGVEMWKKQDVFSDTECSFVLYSLLYIIQTLNIEYHKIKRLFTDSSTNNTQVKTDKNKPPQFTTLEHLFTVNNYTDYLDVLTKIEPQLLKKDNNVYTFCGNKAKHRGCIGAYIKRLKGKGAVNQSVNRDIIAQVLSNEIKNFSIGGTSIDNQSTAYNSIFEPQIEILLASISIS